MPLHSRLHFCYSARVKRAAALARILAKTIVFSRNVCYNIDIFRRRDAPNGEIPKANLLFVSPSVS